MRASFITIIIATFSIILFGCKKSTPPTVTTTSATTQWTIDGITFKGISTYFVSAADLFSSDSSGNAIDVYFSAIPTVNATYTVTALPPSAGQCIVGADLISSDSYTSTGVSGDKVTVTVSGGKVTASFTNITMSDGSVTKTVTGTVAQNK
jgi:hypothetical protein